MGQNWLRSYCLKFGPAGGKGIEISSLRISFDISKSETESANTGTISIWNLNQEHQELAETKDCLVELFAGYENQPLPCIFKGYVTFGNTVDDGADRRTDLECVDGRVETRDTFISKSYSGSVPCNNIIDDAASEMGLAVEYAEDVSFSNIPNGYSVVGQATDALDKACASSGLQWTIDNGILKVKNKGGKMSSRCFVISPDTGLVGFPRKVILSGDYANDDTVYGYEIDYLLNGAIHVSDYLFLDSSKVSGYFMASEIHMSGDTHSGDWMCSATLISC